MITNKNSRVYAKHKSGIQQLYLQSEKHDYEEINLVWNGKLLKNKTLTFMQKLI